MSTLTTILRRAGQIRDEDIERVDEHRRAHRCAPFVSVVELGLADEPTLVRLLSGRLMIPIAAEVVLKRVEPETIKLVPAELAWRFGVLPVSVDDVGNLTLAMADPTDQHAVDAVADHTGAYLLRAVAPVAPLRAAVQYHYGARPQGFRGPATPLQIPRAQEQPMSPPSIEAEPPQPDEPSSDSTRRQYFESSPSQLPEEAPLSPASFARFLPRLVAATDRDAIMEVLLDFLGAGFERVILFIHLRDELKGRDARGEDLVREAVTQVRIPTTGPSVFADVIGSATPHFGRWPSERAIDHAFNGAMGGIRGNVLVLPVKVRDKVPVLVFASGASSVVDSRSLAELVSGVQTALERLIFRRKSMEVPRAT